MLEPFIEDKIKVMLERNVSANKISDAAAAADNVENRIMLGSQPEAVTTTLRDYQMVGLDWMVKMQQMGMPFVLGGT